MLQQEGYDQMGAAFEVYNELGYGMADDVYQSALEVELGLRDIGFGLFGICEYFYPQKCKVGVFGCC